VQPSFSRYPGGRRGRNGLGFPFGECLYKSRLQPLVHSNPVWKILCLSVLELSYKVLHLFPLTMRPIKWPVNMGWKTNTYYDTWNCRLHFAVQYRTFIRPRRRLRVIYMRFSPVGGFWQKKLGSLLAFISNYVPVLVFPRQLDMGWKSSTSSTQSVPGIWQTAVHI